MCFCACALCWGGRLGAASLKGDDSSRHRRRRRRPPPSPQTTPPQTQPRTGTQRFGAFLFLFLFFLSLVSYLYSSQSQRVLLFYYPGWDTRSLWLSSEQGAHVYIFRVGMFSQVARSKCVSRNERRNQKLATQVVETVRHSTPTITPSFSNIITLNKQKIDQAAPATLKHVKSSGDFPPACGVFFLLAPPRSPRRTSLSRG